MSNLPLPQGWKDEPLSTLVERLESGVSVNSEDKPCAPDEFGILKTSCVNGGKFDPSQNKVIVANEIVRAALNPRADSVLISRMNTFDLVGETAYVGGDFPNLFVPDRLWQTVLRGGLETSTKWLSFVVQSPEFRAGVSRAATGTSGSMKNISQGSYLAIRTRIPPPPQQRRIAEILTTVDEAMEQTEALVGKLEQMKAGLMHDLFTRGVTPDGHLRPSRQEAPHLYHETPLGWLPKEWDACELRSKLSFISYGFTNPMPEAEDGPYMVTAADINGGRIQYETCRRTTRSAFDQLLTKKSRPIVGDVLLTKDGTLGRIAVVDREDVCINQSVAVLRPQETRHSTFLAALLSSPRWQDKMIADAGGSTIKHIYITVVDRMLIGWPKIQNEIDRIVECVAQATQTLADETTHLAKLRHQKQGLMQDLLTGRVPV
ncbi:MAG: restriction endonuclease subunit S [Verrucomicrobiaceae bacterium]|nr:restriction endonuclease subunit S [Verrucomicrobiaceae bacterium]